MTLLEKEFQLIGDIYDAAMAPDLWPQVLQQLTDLLECNSAIIAAFDQLNPDYMFAFTHNIPEAPLQVYREKRLDIIDMELHVPAMLQGGVGSIMTSTEAYGSQEEYVRRGGDFYELCLKPSNIYYVAGTLVDHGDFRAATLGLHRPPDWTPMHDGQITQLARLGRHVRRAMQIHRQLSLTRQRNTALYTLLDRLAVGVVLLSADGRIAYANPAAEDLLRQHPFLQVARNSLQCQDRKQNQSLQQLIRAAIATSQRDCQGETGGVLGLTDASRTLPLMLSVMPLSATESLQDLRSDNVAASIFITDPQQGHRVSETLLQDSYGMTPREIEICQAFVNNPAVEMLAPQLGIMLSSLRTHMKNIYEKTGQRSQAELMRLLMGLALDFQHIR